MPDASPRSPRAASPVPRPPAAGGRHLLVDLWVDDPEPLRRAATWEALLPRACAEAGATVLGSRFHQFEPEGATGVVLLAESHASVHTWPERGLATLDVFTCGALDAEAVVARVREAIRPVRERVTVVARGEAALETADGRPPTAASGRRTTDHGPQTTDDEPLTTGARSTASEPAASVSERPLPPAGVGWEGGDESSVAFSPEADSLRDGDPLPLSLSPGETELQVHRLGAVPEAPVPEAARTPVLSETRTLPSCPPEPKGAASSSTDL
ncbi:MAG: adenosylmethionine decarboxylase [Bacteroidota bacterium]